VLETSSTIAVEDSSLPQIAGVNVAEGVNRVAGNRKLYLSLLAEFVSKQAAAAIEIANAVDAGDCKLAERIAHTVKGVAGNLGIPDVQLAAQKLEKAIHEEQESVPTLLDQFAITMRVHTNSIKHALSPGEQLQHPTSAFDRERATIAVKRLRTLLEANDGDSLEAYQSLREAVAGVIDPGLLDALGDTINQFEFTEALLKLEQVAQFCGNGK
jgi:HPt (histidine-containing phosphotransfer) domain-containing protein